MSPHHSDREEHRQEDWTGFEMFVNYIVSIPAQGGLARDTRERSPAILGPFYLTQVDTYKSQTGRHFVTASPSNDIALITRLDGL